MHVLPSSVCSSSPAGRADWREAPGLGTWLRCEDTWTVRNKCWLGKLRPGRGGDLRLLGLRCLQSPVAGGRGLSSCPPPPATTEPSARPALTASADPLQTPGAAARRWDCALSSGTQGGWDPGRRGPCTDLATGSASTNGGSGTLRTEHEGTPGQTLVFQLLRVSLAQCAVSPWLFF